VHDGNYLESRIALLFALRGNFTSLPLDSNTDVFTIQFWRGANGYSLAGIISPASTRPFQSPPPVNHQPGEGSQFRDRQPPVDDAAFGIVRDVYSPCRRDSRRPRTRTIHRRGGRSAEKSKGADPVVSPGQQPWSAPPLSPRTEHHRRTTTVGRAVPAKKKKNRGKTCGYHLNASTSVAPGVRRRRHGETANGMRNEWTNGWTDGRSSAVNARVPTVRRAGSAADWEDAVRRWSAMVRSRTLGSPLVVPSALSLPLRAAAPLLDSEETKRLRAQPRIFWPSVSRAPPPLFSARARARPAATVRTPLHGALRSSIHRKNVPLARERRACMCAASARRIRARARGVFSCDRVSASLEGVVASRGSGTFSRNSVWRTRNRRKSRRPQPARWREATAGGGSAISTYRAIEIRVTWYERAAPIGWRNRRNVKTRLVARRNVFRINGAARKE